MAWLRIPGAFYDDFLAKVVPSGVFASSMGGTETELVKLVASRPDDPMPRLVFADWCEDNDPEWAEYIRLANLEPEGGSFRLREILAARERDWAESFLGLANAWHFDRGMVGFAEGTDELISPAASQVWLRHPVHHLRLHVPPGARLPEKPAWPGHLRHVEIAGHDGVARSWLPRLRPTLPNTFTKLTLDRCGLDTETTRMMDRFGLLAPLHHLELRDNRMFGDNALRALGQSGAKQLRSLNIHHANITPVALGELMGDSPFPLLESLRITLPASFPAGPALGGLFPKFQQGPWAGQLRHLELNGLPFGADNYLALALNRGLNLEALGLGHCRLASEGQYFLQGGPGLEGIRSLDISANEMESPHLQTLARSTCWNGLTSLNISRNRITDAGILAIVQESPVGSQIRKLDISRNRIGGPGLSALATCGKLTRLALGGNYLGPEAIDALWAEGALPSLREMDFSASPLEEKILRILRTKQKPGLTTLGLSDHAAGMLVSKPCPGLAHLDKVRLLGKVDWILARKIFERTGAREIEFIDDHRSWRRNRHSLDAALTASG